MILVLCTSLITSQLGYCDTLILKNGRRINGGQAWVEGDQVKIIKFGGVVGFNKNEVAEIKRTEPSKADVPSTANRQPYQAPTESEIKEFARNKYPNNQKMQRYIYNKQVAAYNYIIKVRDIEVKKIAYRKYPYDYAMQKYTYDKQAAAKRYMGTVTGSDVYEFSKRKYPFDYSMQKYTYDKQLSAKQYMTSVANSNAKRQAVRKYPYDYSMQKYTYDKLAY